MKNMTTVVVAHRRFCSQRQLLKRPFLGVFGMEYALNGIEYVQMDLRWRWCTECGVVVASNILVKHTITVFLRAMRSVSGAAPKSREIY